MVGGEGGVTGVEWRGAGEGGQKREEGIACRALELLLERDPPAPGAPAACEQLLSSARTPEVRAKAFEYLVTRVLAEESGALLEKGLRDAMLPVRLAAIRSVRTLRRRDCTARLVTLASRTGPDEEEGLAIAETMSDLGGEHAERALVSLLASESSAVQIAAAKGLGLHGTITAVAPLLAAAESSGILGGAMRTAVGEAVRAIQARIPEGSAGQLALAPETADAAGAVSLTDTRGALSPVPSTTVKRGEES